MQEVELGVNRLAQVILGASSLTQSVIPSLLTTSPKLLEWKQELRETLERQAFSLCELLDGCEGLNVISPQGAMYAMVQIDCSVLDIKDDMEFSSRLLSEENVFVLPGQAFGVKNVFRVVFCSPTNVLEIAAKRISNFCLRHLNL